MCTTSMSIVEIDRQMDAPSDYYKTSSPSSISEMDVGQQHQQEEVCVFGNESDTGKPSSKTVPIDSPTSVSPDAGDNSLAADGASPGHGGINADVSPAALLTASSTPRKRRWSDVHEAACVGEQSPVKRVQLGGDDDQLPFVDGKQLEQQDNQQDRSCSESLPMDSTAHPADAYDDDDGYYSPACDMDCSARPPSRRTLYIEYWSRTDECKERKWDHLDMIAQKYGAAEDHIFATALNGRTAFLEPNMFPYNTPAGIEHWTLWHMRDLNHEQIKQYVETWIDANAPHVQRWNYDDNPERSIDIFHVHVYLQVGDDDTVLQGRKVESLLHECD